MSQSCFRGRPPTVGLLLPPMAEKKIKAKFVEPMLLLRTEKLPEGDKWAYEVKLDGYRALAIKAAGSGDLRSRNDNDFSLRYPSITRALAALPNGRRRRGRCAG